MKGLRLLVLCVVCFGLVVALASGRDVQRYIVTVKAPIDADVGEVGGAVLHELHLVKAYVVELPAGAHKALARKAHVVRVEEDVEVTAQVFGVLKHAGGGSGRLPPPPPPQQTPWGVTRIGAPTAWATSTGLGVKVAVVDTGIDSSHADLAANVKGGINYVRSGRSVNPSKWQDDNGHGTHVAGTIAAVNNTVGVVGVAPKASLYAVKVLDKNGSGYVSDIILGIQWATDNGMTVINMSLGTSTDVGALKDACDTAATKAILVAAAGNDGGNVLFPARYASVVAAAATDSSNKVPTWSNRGLAAELAAPGVSVLSTWQGGGYATASGTSMATPHVSGVCALVLGTASPPDLVTLRMKLQTTADDLTAYGVGWDQVSGYGLVNAAKAVAGP